MVEINNKTKSKIDLSLVKKISERFLKFKKINNKDVSIVFVGDVVMRRLNRDYRKKDKTTDVLSFTSTTSEKDLGEEILLGEIVISYQQIKKQAKRYGNSIKKELVFILVHGLLHLTAHEDDTEQGRKTMEKLGEEFIKKVKVG